MDALVVIGNFDGVHRGHAAVLTSAVAEASELGLEPTLLTFHPHPAAVLGRVAPPLLTGRDRKRELVARVAPQIRYVEQTFDAAYASQDPEQFARRLVEVHRARRVVVGHNFRFGKGRAGDFDKLVELGGALEFSARSEQLQGDDVGAWSSTRVRSAIERGDLPQAERILGRPHMVSGTVVKGKQLGRTLGFPTCNLDDVVEAALPFGVYAVLIDVRRGGGFRALAKGAMSVGINPTTDRDNRVKYEVHAIDFDGDLYGAQLRVHVVQRLRGEAKFEGLDELVAQIRRDVDACREHLIDRVPEPSTGCFA